MRLLIAALLSAAMITMVPHTQSTPVNNLGTTAAHTEITGQRPKAILTAKPVAEAEKPQAQLQASQPETAPPPAEPQPQVQGCAAYVPLLQQYDWNVNVMEAICQAESGGDPNAISPPNWDGLRDYGLMQIHGEYILDPSANIARAYQKYQSQGLRAWSTYRTGAYLKYL